MQVTETGYYETRDGGLAYVAGICSPDILEGEFKEFRVFGALVPSTEEREHGAHWKINGARGFAGDWGDDLIRYIGKELPEVNTPELENPLYNCSIYEADLSTRTINSLINGFDYWDNKLSLTFRVLSEKFSSNEEFLKYIRRLPGIGRKTINELAEFLAIKNLNFGNKNTANRKPQPERVELKDLWVGWYKVGDHSFCHTPFCSEQSAIYSHVRGYDIVAITPADATSFVIGEGLE